MEEIRIRPAKKDDDFRAVAVVYLKTWQRAYLNILPPEYLTQINVNTWQPKNVGRPHTWH